MNQDPEELEFREGLIRLLIASLGCIIAIALSVLVMIKGWGLEPKSWWWIIGVGVFTRIFALFARVKGK